VLGDVEAQIGSWVVLFGQDLQESFLDVKRKLFADLDGKAPAHAILATNSSYIVSSRIADVTRRPGKVLNLHFFNPALVMKLVEVVQGRHVSDETAQISMALCERLDKVGVHLRKEVEGFLLNRILRAIAQEAFWLLEMGWRVSRTLTRPRSMALDIRWEHFA